MMDYLPIVVMFFFSVASMSIAQFLGDKIRSAMFWTAFGWVCGLGGLALAFKVAELLP